MMVVAGELLKCGVPFQAKGSDEDLPEPCWHEPQVSRWRETGVAVNLRNTWIVDYGDSSIPSRRRVIMQAMPGKRSYGTGELHEKHGAYFGATDFGRAPTGPVGRSPDRQTAASRGSRNAGTTRPHSRVSVDEVQSGSAP